MEQNTLKRHTMVYTGPSGLWHARKTAKPVTQGLPPEYLDKLFRTPEAIPAIVRMQTNAAPGWLDVGFSFPCRFQGQRVRVAASIPPGSIRRVVTPGHALDIALKAPRHPHRALLSGLKSAARQAGVQTGLFGSYALAALTGLPYTNENSDIDLLVEGSSAAILQFADAVGPLARQAGVRLDMEARLAGQCDVKVQELARGKETLLCKTLSGVQLLQRRGLA